MKVYFVNCSSPGEIKAMYRELAMKHHPDRGGSTRIMQDINSEYHDLLKSKDKQKFQYQGTEKWTVYNYVWRNEQDVVETVEALIKLNLPTDVEILIIGLYVWVRGNTKPVKDQLRSITGMRWHSKRLCWYWRPSWMSSSYTAQPLSTLMQTYGGRVVDHASEKEPEPVVKEIE